MVQIPKFLSLEDGYAAYRPIGECTFDTAVDMIDGALAYCTANDIPNLLVDITGVTGFPPPSTAQRFQFATRWSSTAAGRVCVSLVARPELIDEEHIGVTMANNRGSRARFSRVKPKLSGGSAPAAFETLTLDKETAANLAAVLIFSSGLAALFSDLAAVILSDDYGG